MLRSARGARHRARGKDDRGHESFPGAAAWRCPSARQPDGLSLVAAMCDRNPGYAANAGPDQLRRWRLGSACASRNHRELDKFRAAPIGVESSARATPICARISMIGCRASMACGSGQHARNGNFIKFTSALQPCRPARTIVGGATPLNRRRCSRQQLTHDHRQSQACAAMRNWPSDAVTRRITR